MLSIPVLVAIAVFVEQLHPSPPSDSARLGSTYKDIDYYNRRGNRLLQLKAKRVRPGYRTLNHFS